MFSNWLVTKELARSRWILIRGKADKASTKADTENWHPRPSSRRGSGKRALETAIVSIKRSRLYEGERTARLN